MTNTKKTNHSIRPNVIVQIKLYCRVFTGLCYVLYASKGGIDLQSSLAGLLPWASYSEAVSQPDKGWTDTRLQYLLELKLGIILCAATNLNVSRCPNARRNLHPRIALTNANPSATASVLLA